MKVSAQFDDQLFGAIPWLNGLADHRTQLFDTQTVHGGVRTAANASCKHSSHLLVWASVSVMTCNMPFVAALRATVAHDVLTVSHLHSVGVASGNATVRTLGFPTLRLRPQVHGVRSRRFGRRPPDRGRSGRGRSSAIALLSCRCVEISAIRRLVLSRMVVAAWTNSRR
jgi:hypothetical protein